MAFREASPFLVITEYGVVLELFNVLFIATILNRLPPSYNTFINDNQMNMKEVDSNMLIHNI